MNAKTHSHMGQDRDLTAEQLDNDQNETLKTDEPSTTVGLQKTVQRYVGLLRMYYGQYLRLDERIKLFNRLQSYSHNREEVDFDALSTAEEGVFAVEVTGMLGTRGADFHSRFALDRSAPVADASSDRPEVH